MGLVQADGLLQVGGADLADGQAPARTLPHQGDHVRGAQHSPASSPCRCPATPLAAAAVVHTLAAVAIRRRSTLINGAVAQVWNEPNGGFWHPGPLGSQQDTYFRLYQETANALKSVSADMFKVGGPATAGCPGWTAELVAFAHANHTALDFVSCHN